MGTTTWGCGAGEAVGGLRQAGAEGCRGRGENDDCGRQLWSHMGESVAIGSDGKGDAVGEKLGDRTRCLVVVVGLAEEERERLCALLDWEILRG